MKLVTSDAIFSSMVHAKVSLIQLLIFRVVVRMIRKRLGSVCLICEGYFKKVETYRD
jgi:hypothetical protein